MKQFLTTTVFTFVVVVSITRVMMSSRVLKNCIILNEIEDSPQISDSSVLLEDGGGFCPSLIRNKVGLFNEKTSNSTVKDEFPDTVLLVSSNYAYYNMLQNWEWLANQLDLKWAVLALDDKLYDELGPERAVAPDESFSVSGPQSFRRGEFHTLSCNKMRMALEIADNCKVNVIFTDADNVFFKNPFEHDLGKLIRSNRYDYLYQPNKVGRGPREHKCMMGTPDKEHNTGFYYIRHGTEVYKRVVESTLERCHRPENRIDDQTLFWEEFWKLKKKLNGSVKYQHCGYDDAILHLGDGGETSSTFRWCCMDPYYYSIGKTIKKPNRDPITYHANYARGYAEKVKKLQSIRPDTYGWNQTRFIDGKGEILTE